MRSVAQRLGGCGWTCRPPSAQRDPLMNANESARLPDGNYCKRGIPEFTFLTPARKMQYLRRIHFPLGLPCDASYTRCAPAMIEQGSSHDTTARTGRGPPGIGDR